MTPCNAELPAYSSVFSMSYGYSDRLYRPMAAEPWGDFI